MININTAIIAPKIAKNYKVVKPMKNLSSSSTVFFPTTIYPYKVQLQAWQRLSLVGPK